MTHEDYNNEEKAYGEIQRLKHDIIIIYLIIITTDIMITIQTLTHRWIQNDTDYIQTIQMIDWLHDNIITITLLITDWHYYSLIQMNDDIDDKDSKR